MKLSQYSTGLETIKRSIGSLGLSSKMFLSVSFVGFSPKNNQMHRVFLNTTFHYILNIISTLMYGNRKGGAFSLLFCFVFLSFRPSFSIFRCFFCSLQLLSFFMERFLIFLFIFFLSLYIC